MVTYDYYCNEYMGTELDQKVFDTWILRAREELDRICRTYVVRGGADAKAMAMCAMAEVLHRSAGRRGVVSAGMGGVNVRYGESSPRSLSRELLQKAAIYLDIYRGRWAD